MRMSFYNGTLDRAKLREMVETAEDIRYTYGLGYRGPSTNRVPITKERALEIIKTESLLDADDEKGYLHLNAYSANDMW